MLTGQMFNITFQNLNEQRIGFQVTLPGFKSAYDKIK